MSRDGKRSGDSLWESLRSEDVDEVGWMESIPLSNGRENPMYSPLNRLDWAPGEAHREEYVNVVIYADNIERVLMDKEISERWETGMELEEEELWAYFGCSHNIRKVEDVMELTAEGMKQEQAESITYKSGSGVSDRLRCFNDSEDYLEERYREDFRGISRDKALTSTY